MDERPTLALPAQGAGQWVAVRVGAEDLQHGHVGQALRGAERAAADRGGGPVGLHPGEQRAQRRPLLRAEAEVARDLRLADAALRLREEGTDVRSRGQRRGLRGPRAAGHLGARRLLRRARRPGFLPGGLPFGRRAEARHVRPSSSPPRASWQRASSRALPSSPVPSSPTPSSPTPSSPAPSSPAPRPSSRPASAPARPS